jgi:hypothetical protein
VDIPLSSSGASRLTIAADNTKTFLLSVTGAELSLDQTRSHLASFPPDPIKFQASRLHPSLPALPIGRLPGLTGSTKSNEMGIWIAFPCATPMIGHRRA